MTKFYRHLSAKALLLTSLSVLTLASAQAQDASFSDAQKEEMRTVFKEYLMENPELIADAMTALRDKQENMQAEQAKAKITEYAEYFKTADLPYTGNKDGDVVVVEFFDYNCGYCKKAFPDVQALLKKDPNVKVVFMEMPILGPTSLTAAQWAEAAHKQGKYFEFHTALFDHQGQYDVEELRKLATDLGLDVAQMEKDAQSEEVQERINKSVQVGQDIGARGTPAFIVGDTLFPGYIGEAALIQSVADARKK